MRSRSSAEAAGGPRPGALALKRAEGGPGQQAAGAPVPRGPRSASRRRRARSGREAARAPPPPRPAAPRPPDPKLELSNDADGKHARLQFEGKAGEGTSYSLDLELYGAVDKEKSKFHTMPRNIVMVLEKAEAGSWPRLTKASSKGDKHIKVRRRRSAAPRCAHGERRGQRAVCAWRARADQGAGRPTVRPVCAAFC